MAVNYMTKRQFVCIIACFLQGSVLYTMYYHHLTGNEAWITLLGGTLLGLFAIYLYSSLCKMYDCRDLVEVNEAVFGRIPGKIISFFYIYTFLLSCSVTVRQTGQFVAGNLLMETNWIYILLLLVLTCAWASNSGIKYFASVSTVTCVLMYIFSVLMFLLLLPQMELKYFLPLGQCSTSEYVKSTTMTMAMPFSELSALMMLVPELKNEKEKTGLWRQFALGILIGAPFILLTVLRDTFVLGPLLNTFSYPVYEAIRLINFNVISHVESIFGAFLIFLLFFKSGVVFYCITRMLARIFNCQKNIVFTAFLTGLLLLCSLQITDSNIGLLQMVLNKVFYVLLAVQVGLPAVTLVTAKIKNAVKNKRKAGGAACG